MFLFRRRKASTPATSRPARSAEESHYRYMVGLINKARQAAGSPPLALGESQAPQRHAEDCLKVGLSSHWNLNGLKPYMRYSLAGGYQANAENVCHIQWTGRQGITDIPQELAQAMTKLMGSPGHRRNILNQWYRKVSLGIAWNGTQFTVAQHFEGDFVEFGSLPSLSEGTLRFAGRLKNTVHFDSPEDLKVNIWYDPPPHPLTVGQLIRVNGYDHGTIVAALRRRLPSGQFWTEDSATIQIERLPKPEDFPAHISEPRSLQERQKMFEQAYLNNNRVQPTSTSISYITCRRWEVSQSDFSVAADVRELVKTVGPGVYTLMLWGPAGGNKEDVTLSQYSMFVN